MGIIKKGMPIYFGDEKGCAGSKFTVLDAVNEVKVINGELIETGDGVVLVANEQGRRYAIPYSHFAGMKKA